MAKQSKRKHTQAVARPPATRIKAIDKLLERGDVAAAGEHTLNAYMTNIPLTLP